MSDAPSYLPSALVLGTLLLTAAAVTAARPRVKREVTTTRRFAAVVGLAIIAQGAHFVEELVRGFDVQFPAALGLQPIPETLFVAFNVGWLAVWSVAAVAMRDGRAIAACPLWFLALASIVNLVAHPALALLSGGYFPGLLTAPLAGLLGALLLRELVRATAD